MFTKQDFAVDLVVLWCDGKASDFTAHRDYWVKQNKIESVQATHLARFVSTDELRYMLRSVEQNIPWVRYVWVVTNGQIPSWLNLSNPKLKLIFHEKFMPKEVLPTFNSCAIESSLWRLPGLAEHFLIANDDTFIWRAVKKESFFPREGYVYNYYKPAKWALQGIIPEGLHGKILWHTRNLVRQRFPSANLVLEPHHNIDGYLKTVCAKSWELFPAQLQQTQASRFRQADNVSRWIFSAMSVIVKRGKWKAVCRRKVFRYMSDYWELWESYASALKKYKPCLVCLNDSENSTGEQREKMRLFLEKQFPYPSSFEN